ncbi:MAG: EamA family transporter [Treponema sp.]|jgi:drug/metabolite transporter (DMT)-like permease|nr:EamA family transporter [Treponema sp.]
MAYYFPLILIVIANLCYHVTQKNTSDKINPFFSLFVTYFVAALVSIIILIFYKHKNTFIENIKELNWSTFLLGVAIVLLELGFLLAYRLGWNISTTQIISTVIVTIILAPIGKFFFKESISFINIIGIGVSIVGVILMNYAKK